MFFWTFICPFFTSSAILQLSLHGAPNGRELVLHFPSMKQSGKVHTEASICGIVGPRELDPITSKWSFSTRKPQSRGTLSSDIRGYISESKTLHTNKKSHKQWFPNCRPVGTLPAASSTPFFLPLYIVGAIWPHRLHNYLFHMAIAFPLQSSATLNNHRAGLKNCQVWADSDWNIFSQVLIQPQFFVFPEFRKIS